MRVIKTIKPQSNGAKKLSAKYGNKLVAVRYRVDKEKKIRYKTIEIIVDRQPII